MESELKTKEMVRDKYSAIAAQDKTQPKSCGCGSKNHEVNDNFTIMADDYAAMKGYVKDADLGLGCGLPTAFAQIQKGNTVIDLGSGAGNDAFIARAGVGETGRVIGIDFSPEMIRRARENTDKLGFNNVEFRQGDIDDMPVTSNMADVVISNCVLNLVPDKPKVFREMYRVLKPGGHFSISDIVVSAPLPERWKEIASLYAGCISSAILREDYLRIIQESGFVNMTLQKEKKVDIPEEILKQYLSDAEIEEYNKSNARAISITVFAEKPAAKENKCCGSGCGCS